MLNPVVTNVSVLIIHIKLGGISGCSAHTLVRFTVLRHMVQARSKFQENKYLDTQSSQ